MNPLVLLPAPQIMRALPGVFTVSGEVVLSLRGEAGPGLLPVGQLLRAALERAGMALSLTAAPVGDTPLVILELNPAVVRRPEGYRLLILPDQVRITAHDVTGAFRGAVTLRQIARQCAGTGILPCLEIDDWPDFARRGVMLDISRDKVPTMTTLFALVDQLADLKLNELQLYTEHTFAYRNHREIWEYASPMTAAEILELDAYCRERHVALVPNQNSFGHMERWLRHPRYAPLAEAPNGFDFPWGHCDRPFSLCPIDPGSEALIAGLYDELLPNFTSRQFNVGCDETFDVGQGRSADIARERGKGRVYLEFLLKIHRHVQRHGRAMQFWGDIILHHPELIPELPKDVIPLVWGYEADHPFAGQCAEFAKTGFRFYVCPGTSSWNSIAGRTDNALGNLRNAAINGLAAGAAGYLITDWGDNGHWQPLPVSYLGYAFGAAMSWAVRANADLDLARALDVHLFQDAAGVMGRLAVDLGNVYQAVGLLTPNASLPASLLCRDAEQPFAKPGEVTWTGLEKARSAIADAISLADGARMIRPDAELVKSEFRQAASLLDYSCREGLARSGTADWRLSSVPLATRREFAARLQELIAEQTRTWLARNRSGGLTDSLTGLRQRRERCQA